MSGTRILFLDDSGKPDAQHVSTAVVIAGFSIPSDQVTLASRRILGAKAKYFRGRGRPVDWEVKAGDIIKPNPWKRRKNRDFTDELIRIVGGLNGTIYSVTLDKAAMKHQMGLHQTMPLQMQALVEHFSVECQHHGETGMIISDWCSHQADQHASRCVASFVVSRRLKIHPCVYYASSHATQAIQVADLIAGIRRRTAEGDTSFVTTNMAIAATRSVGPIGLRTCRKRTYNPLIQLF